MPTIQNQYYIAAGVHNRRWYHSTSTAHTHGINYTQILNWSSKMSQGPNFHILNAGNILNWEQQYIT